MKKVLIGVGFGKEILGRIPTQGDFYYRRNSSKQDVCKGFLYLVIVKLLQKQDLKHLKLNNKISDFSGH